MSVYTCVLFLPYLLPHLLAIAGWCVHSFHQVTVGPWTIGRWTPLEMAQWSFTQWGMIIYRSQKPANSNLFCLHFLWCDMRIQKPPEVSFNDTSSKCIPSLWLKDFQNQWFFSVVNSSQQISLLLIHSVVLWIQVSFKHT